MSAWENSANERLIRTMFGYRNDFRFIMKPGIDQAIESAMEHLNPKEIGALAECFIMNGECSTRPDKYLYVALRKMRNPVRSREIRKCLVTEEQPEYWCDYRLPMLGLDPGIKRDWNMVLVYKMKEGYHLVKLVYFDREDALFHNEFSVPMNEKEYHSFCSLMDSRKGEFIKSVYGIETFYELKEEPSNVLNRMEVYCGVPDTIFVFEKKNNQLADLLAEYEHCKEDGWVSVIRIQPDGNGRVHVLALEYQPDVSAYAGYRSFYLEEDKGSELLERASRFCDRTDSAEELKKKLKIEEESLSFKDFAEKGQGEILFVRQI